MNKAFLLCLLLIGCYSPKKALKQLNNAFNEHPDVVAKFANEKYPIKVSKVDTIVVSDTGYLFVQEYVQKTDTIVDTITKTKYIVKNVDKIKVVTKNVTITKMVVDTARVAELTFQLNQCNLDQRKSKEKSNKSITWLLIFLCISLFINSLLLVFKR